jgi:hypothetical protein
MKKIIGSLLVILVSASSFALSNKVCYGSAKSTETKGVILNVSIERDQIFVKKIQQGPGTVVFADKHYSYGTYAAYNTKINSNTKKAFLAFKGEEPASDYADVILVQAVLLEKEMSGLLKMISIDESFEDRIFLCKNPVK